jgi:hypothetical protein
MPKLLDRLESKLKAQWTKDPYGLAVSILLRNWYLNPDGSLTDKWKIKENMPEWMKWIKGKPLWQQIRDTLSKTYNDK